MKVMTLSAGMRLSASAIAFALLAGCSLVPTYERPAAPVPATLPLAAGTTASKTTAADLPWQDFVSNPHLRQLVALALENNRDLRVAVQNVEQARAQFQIRRAGQFPHLDGNLNGSRSQPNPAAALGGGSVASTYTVGLGVTAWELDFFGRVAALKDVALAQFLATDEARKAAQTSLIASVVSTWLQTKTDTELLVLAERTLATRQQSLDLIQLQFDHGVATALTLNQARGLVESTKANRAQQQRLRAQDLHLLALLVGTELPAELIPSVPQAPTLAAPQDLSQPTVAVAPVADLPQFAPVPVGLSSDVLLRRPDIHQAEEQLIAANANIGAARANFFPRITLTGSFGRVSTDLSGLVGSGGQKAWSFAPAISLPLFDAGQNRAILDAAKAARKSAVAQYEKAIQTAFREVADALVGRTTLADQLVALRAQTDAARQSFELADLQYRNGVSSFLDLLDAQRALFSVEQQLAQIQLAQRVNEVQLYRALGGGWIAPDGLAENQVAAAPERS